mgnify:CR=1 FL=1
MKWIFVIVVIILAIFILVFLAGMASAAYLGSKKNRRTFAVGLLSQMPKEVIIKLIDILLRSKNNQVKEVNEIVADIETVQLDQLLGLFGPKNRPKEFSAGKFGDNLSWTAMEDALQDHGYTINASKLLTGITFHNIDDILIEMNQKYGR